jgi:hypothetical protein
MTAFLTMVTEFMTALVGWIPDLTAVIIADPLLVLPFVVLVVGLVVGIIGRLLALR